MEPVAPGPTRKATRLPKAPRFEREREVTHDRLERRLDLPVQLMLWEDRIGTLKTRRHQCSTLGHVRTAEPSEFGERLAGDPHRLQHAFSSAVSGEATQVRAGHRASGMDNELEPAEFKRRSFDHGLERALTLPPEVQKRCTKLGRKPSGVAGRPLVHAAQHESRTERACAACTVPGDALLVGDAHDQAAPTGQGLDCRVHLDTRCAPRFDKSEQCPSFMTRS